MPCIITFFATIQPCKPRVQAPFSDVQSVKAEIAAEPALYVSQLDQQCVMQRGVAQHVARYGGNVGSETWPFWLDVQVSLFLLLTVLCTIKASEMGLSEAARLDCISFFAVHMHVID